MIAPDTRGRFTDEDLALVLSSLARATGTPEELVERWIAREGLDAILDQPPLVQDVLAAPLPGPSPSLLFYLLVRHAFLREGIDDRVLTDYCAALLREFGIRRRAFRVHSVDDQEHVYLVDILADLATAEDPRRYRILVHLGEYSLWLGGLFPDRIEAGRRRGAPDLSYYEELGHRGYAAASDHRLADRAGLAGIYRTAAERFGDLRRALAAVGAQLALRAA